MSKMSLSNTTDPIYYKEEQMTWQKNEHRHTRKLNASLVFTEHYHEPDR